MKKPDCGHSFPQLTCDACEAFDWSGCRPSASALAMADARTRDAYRRGGGVDPEDMRLRRVLRALYPEDPTRCAEPIDIEDARWLLNRFLSLNLWITDWSPSHTTQGGPRVLP
jgi:hypothetical protein